MINIKEFLGLTYYTSELDQFLSKIDKEMPNPSASQQAEIKKYERVFKLRDGQLEEPTNKRMWDKF